MEVWWWRRSNVLVKCHKCGSVCGAFRLGSDVIQSDSNICHPADLKEKACKACLPASYPEVCRIVVTPEMLSGRAA